jgi:hypothetical protein
MVSRLKHRNPKPLVVGITGHRPNHMPECEWNRVRQTLATVMRDIALRHPRQKCRLLSGLAEGADRLAACVALGLGWPFDVVLAFHRTRFEKDFPQPHAVGEFRALLAAASSIKEPGRRWHVGRPPEDGYDGVSAALQKLCAVLIAIWDGKNPRGRGGTRAVIDAARRCGIEVIWIHAVKAVPPRTLAATGHAFASRRRDPISSDRGHAR